MKKEKPEIAHLIINAKAKEGVGIRTQAKWCFIDFGDYAYGCGLHCKRNYEQKGSYKVIITGENIEAMEITGCCSFADFSECNRLQQISVCNTGLQGIDLRRCRELRQLECGFNKLMLLDLCDSPQLLRLECENNLLRWLILRRTCHLSYLQCNDNQLKEINIPGKSSLLHVDCSNNRLPKESLNKIFSKLPLYSPEKQAEIIFEGNPGCSQCNQKKIIAKGWEIGKSKSKAA